MGLTRTIVLLLFLNFCSLTVKCEIHCDRGEPQELREVLIDEDDDLHSQGIGFGKHEYFKNGSSFFACPCDIRTCVRQCPKEVLTLYKAAAFTNETLIMSNGMNVINEIYILEARCAEHHVSFELSKDEIYEINKDGELIFTRNNVKKLLKIDLFCFGDNGDNLKVIMCDATTSKQAPQMNEALKSSIIILLIISEVSLAFTVIALFLGSDTKSMQGKNIVCQSFSLMIGMIGFTVMALAPGTQETNPTCKITGYITYFFMMSSFFWLNAMCFDIFWTFSNIKKLARLKQESHTRKFHIYVVYCTALPFTLCATLVICDNVLKDGIFYPGFGVNKCWFDFDKNRFGSAEVMYYQIPVMILLLENVVFFIIALSRITNMRRGSRRELKRTNSIRHSENNDSQRASLYLKLFFLTGGTWLMECLSWWCNSKPAWLFATFDIINSSRGIMIFIMCVVLNAKVRKSARNHLSSFYKKTENENSTATRTEVLEISRDTCC